MSIAGHSAVGNHGARPVKKEVGRLLGLLAVLKLRAEKEHAHEILV